MWDEILDEILEINNDSNPIEINRMNNGSHYTIRNNVGINEFNYAHEVLTDHTIYELKLINKYQQMEYDSNIREIYDSETQTEMHYFSQDSTSFEDSVDEFEITEMHTAQGFPHMDLKSIISEICLMTDENSIEDKYHEQLITLELPSEEQAVESQQMIQLSQQTDEMVERKEQKGEESFVLQELPYKAPNDTCYITGCTYRPSRPRDLTKHIKTVHLKQYDFQCDCSKKFASKQSLREHKNRHFGKKAFKCRFENCTKTFTSRSSISYHMKNHH